jgi:hypothetical protein
MAIGYATALRTTRITAVLTAIDAATGAGTGKLYSGTRPATGAAVTTQTLLATLTFSTTSGTVSNGVLTFSAITADSSADADGTATWARIADGDGNFVADLSVGATGSGADIILNNVNIVAGGEVSISSASITEGNA